MPLYSKKTKISSSGLIDQHARCFSKSRSVNLIPITHPNRVVIDDNKDSLDCPSSQYLKTWTYVNALKRSIKFIQLVLHTSLLCFSQRTNNAFFLPLGKKGNKTEEHFSCRIFSILLLFLENDSQKKISRKSRINDKEKDIKYATQKEFWRKKWNFLDD